MLHLRTQHNTPKNKCHKAQDMTLTPSKLACAMIVSSMHALPGYTPSKMTIFLRFQIHQAVSMISEEMPLRVVGGVRELVAAGCMQLYNPT
jgi:hypothetical protein